MYLNSILWIFSWSILIISSYFIIKYTINKYESILEKPVKKLPPKV